MTRLPGLAQFREPHVFDHIGQVVGFPVVDLFSPRLHDRLQASRLGFKAEGSDGSGMLWPWLFVVMRRRRRLGWLWRGSAAPAICQVLNSSAVAQSRCAQWCACVAEETEGA